jgi:hypothetical protein
LTGGRSSDRNFLRFSTIFGEKIVVSSQKPMFYSKFCIIYVALSWVKNANFSPGADVMIFVTRLNLTQCHPLRPAVGTKTLRGAVRIGSDKVDIASSIFFNILSSDILDFNFFDYDFLYSTFCLWTFWHRLVAPMHKPKLFTDFHRLFTKLFTDFLIFFWTSEVDGGCGWRRRRSGRRNHDFDFRHPFTG